MVTPQTPRVAKEILCDDLLPISRSVSGRMDNQSTAPQKNLLSSVSPTQENAIQSTTNIDAEVTSPAKKARKEKGTEVPTYIKACQATITYARSVTDTQDLISFQSTKGIRSERQTREARHPISSSEDNCVPSNTCNGKNIDDSAKNSLGRKQSVGSSSHLLDVVEVEQSEVVISLPAPNLQCQEKEHLLPTSKKKESLCVKKIKLHKVHTPPILGLA